MASTKVSPKLRAHTHTKILKLVAIAADGFFTIPAGWMIDEVVIENTTANAVTGGVNFGTTDAGQQIIAAEAIAGSFINAIALASLLKRFFSRTVDTTVYFTAGAAWNNAVLNVWVNLTKLSP